MTTILKQYLVRCQFLFLLRGKEGNVTTKHCMSILRTSDWNSMSHQSFSVKLVGIST